MNSKMGKNSSSHFTTNTVTVINIWVSQVAKMVKDPPAMWETWIQPLGWEDPLGEGMATHSSILAWRIPKDRRPWRARVHGSQSLGHDWVTQHSTQHMEGYSKVTHESTCVNIYMHKLGFPCKVSGKEPSANAGDIRDTDSIPGSGRSTGGGHGNSLQYFCLENSRDREPGWLWSMGSLRAGHDWIGLSCMQVCNLYKNAFWVIHLFWVLYWRKHIFLLIKKAVLTLVDMNFNPCNYSHHD